MICLRRAVLAPILFASVVHTPILTRPLSTSRKMLQQPHVLVIGGAYAGIAALNSLIDLSAGKALPVGRGPPPGGNRGPGNGPPPAQVPETAAEPPRALQVRPRYTLLDERDGFYHTVGAPLGQITPSYAHEFWIKYENIVKDTFANEDVQFIHGSAVALDTQSKTVTYSNAGAKPQDVSYDYLIVATGMRRGVPVVPKALEKSAFLSEVEQMSTELKNASMVAVVGGGKNSHYLPIRGYTDLTLLGAVGIEMAAKIQLEYPDSEVILIHSRDKLISAEPLPDEYKAKAFELLSITGTQIKLGQRVTSQRLVESDSGPARTEITLSSGETILCDKVIYSATQKGANTPFIPKQGCDANGCILVRDT
jgi:NADH dehydrogenase FAD-containing subunit